LYRFLSYRRSRLDGCRLWSGLPFLLGNNRLALDGLEVVVEEVIVGAAAELVLHFGSVLQRGCSVGLTNGGDDIER
jgi:hypothetical protein